MIRVGILGATGYTALELMKILVRHPEAEVVALTSRQETEPHVAAVHPPLAGRLDLKLENKTAAAIAERVDCLFSCLPHAASAEAIVPLLQREVRIVDLSADFRLWNADDYQAWYGQRHPARSNWVRSSTACPNCSVRVFAQPGWWPIQAVTRLPRYWHYRPCCSPT